MNGFLLFLIALGVERFLKSCKASERVLWTLVPVITFTLYGIIFWFNQ